MTSIPGQGTGRIQVPERADRVTPAAESADDTAPFLEDQQAEFSDLLDRNQHRFRAVILREIRSSPVSDLTAPGLGLIKRRILTKSNALFGKPHLKAAISSQFSFVDH